LGCHSRTVCLISSTLCLPLSIHLSLSLSLSLSLFLFLFIFPSVCLPCVSYIPQGFLSSNVTCLSGSGSSWAACLAASPDCPQEWLNDGLCDADCDSAACNRDCGDCPGTRSATTSDNAGGEMDERDVAALHAHYNRRIQQRGPVGVHRGGRTRSLPRRPPQMQPTTSVLTHHVYDAYGVHVGTRAQAKQKVCVVVLCCVVVWCVG
jgi:hypothetical protein